MWTIYALSEILILSIILAVLSAETQVAVSYRNTCVLNGTAVYCWGDGIFVILFEKIVSFSKLVNSDEMHGQ